jgi:hypothetical protein
MDATVQFILIITTLGYIAIELTNINRGVWALYNKKGPSRE